MKEGRKEARNNMWTHQRTEGFATKFCLQIRGRSGKPKPKSEVCEVFGEGVRSHTLIGLETL